MSKSRAQRPSSITLVTCEDQPALTPSDQLLAVELEARGRRVRVAGWRDQSVDWAESALTVLRSTWDACKRHHEFLSWLERAEALTTLVTPPVLLRWNFDKRYLLDLEARGVPIIPSQYLSRGVSLSGLSPRWDEVVVKPVIGGSSLGVRHFQLSQGRESMEQHLTYLLDRTGVLIQRYEPTVCTDFERSLVFIAGAFSHAVRRIPFNTGNTPDTDEFDHSPSSEEIWFARNTLRIASAHSLPFARVDLLPSADGLLLMELELIDPALFLTRRPQAAAELAAALAPNPR